MAKCLQLSFVTALLLASSAYFYLINMKRVNLPDHTLGHPVHFYENLIDDETFQELNRYTREIG